MSRDGDRPIAFDATALETGQPAGVGRYSRELLSALLRAPDAPSIALLAARPLPEAVVHGTYGQIGPRFPNRTLWMQLVLPRTLARLAPRLAHFTNFTAPLIGRTPYVLTIHDMTLFLYSETQAFRHLAAARGIIPRAARRAAAVIAVSESARRDIIHVLQVAPERVRVVPSGVDRRFHPIADVAMLQRVRAKYRLPGEFVLHVGTIEPRKNIDRLVEAFTRVRRSGRTEDLVLVGQLGWKYRSALRRIAESTTRGAIHVLGYIDDHDLPAVYNLARLATLPSLYEGFGLPILEAMACGTPVVTSDRPATREVAGGAARLVDPESIDSIAAGISDVLDDEPLRERLRRAGPARAAEFSWVRTARETLRVYDEVG